MVIFEILRNLFHKILSIIKEQCNISVAEGGSPPLRPLSTVYNSPVRSQGSRPPSVRPQGSGMFLTTFSCIICLVPHRAYAFHYC